MSSSVILRSLRASASSSSASLRLTSARTFTSSSVRALKEGDHGSFTFFLSFNAIKHYIISLPMDSQLAYYQAIHIYIHAIGFYNPSKAKYTIRIETTL